MHELLPETWMEEEQSEVAALWGFLFLKKTKTSVTDILCWVQAYAILVSVLAVANGIPKYYNLVLSQF